jgi:hypothetical protein
VPPWPCLQRRRHELARRQPTVATTPATGVRGIAPAALLGGGSLFGSFGIFSGLRHPAPPAGLFMADLEASGLDAAQPRRLATSVNTFGLI